MAMKTKEQKRIEAEARRRGMPTHGQPLKHWARLNKRGGGVAKKERTRCIEGFKDKKLTGTMHLHQTQLMEMVEQQDRIKAAKEHAGKAVQKFTYGDGTFVQPNNAYLPTPEAVNDVREAMAEGGREATPLADLRTAMARVGGVAVPPVPRAITAQDLQDAVNEAAAVQAGRLREGELVTARRLRNDEDPPPNPAIQRALGAMRDENGDAVPPPPQLVDQGPVGAWRQNVENLGDDNVMAEIPVEEDDEDEDILEDGEEGDPVEGLGDLGGNDAFPAPQIHEGDDEQQA